eukprot:g19451.t1
MIGDADDPAEEQIMPLAGRFLGAHLADSVHDLLQARYESPTRVPEHRMQLQRQVEVVSRVSYSWELRYGLGLRRKKSLVELSHALRQRTVRLTIDGQRLLDDCAVNGTVWRGIDFEIGTTLSFSGRSRSRPRRLAEEEGGVAERFRFLLKYEESDDEDIFSPTSYVRQGLASTSRREQERDRGVDVMNIDTHHGGAACSGGAAVVGEGGTTRLPARITEGDDEDENGDADVPPLHKEVWHDLEDVARSVVVAPGEDVVEDTFSALRETKQRSFTTSPPKRAADADDDGGTRSKKSELPATASPLQRRAVLVAIFLAAAVLFGTCWLLLPPPIYPWMIPAPRKAHFSGLLHDRLFVFSGRGAHKAVLTDLWSYDFYENKWSRHRQQGERKYRSCESDVFIRSAEVEETVRRRGESVDERGPPKAAQLRPPALEEVPEEGSRQPARRKPAFTSEGALQLQQETSSLEAEKDEEEHSEGERGELVQEDHDVATSGLHLNVEGLDFDSHPAAKRSHPSGRFNGCHVSTKHGLLVYGGDEKFYGTGRPDPDLMSRELWLLSATNHLQKPRWKWLGPLTWDFPSRDVAVAQGRGGHVERSAPACAFDGFEEKFYFVGGRPGVGAPDNILWVIDLKAFLTGGDRLSDLVARQVPVEGDVRPLPVKGGCGGSPHAFTK